MKKALMLGALSLSVLTLLLLSFRGRSRPTVEPSKSHRKVDSSARHGYYVPRRDPVPMADTVLAAKAYSDATLKSTYKNFRTAIATQNILLRDALKPKLTSDAARVIGWAEEDLARASKPNDIEIARKTLESLRN